MRFRLVEEINDKHAYSQKELLEKTDEQLVREFVIGLSTDEIVKKGGGFTSSSVKKGASFILPDGNLYFSDNGKGEELHENILANILVTIIGNETGVWLDWITHLDEDGEDLMYNYLIDKLGWIKANTGLASVERRCYLVIPHRDSKRPTNLQYYTLEELLEYAKKADKKKVTVYEGMNGSEDFDYYLFADTPEGIVRSIRGFYARGYFLHEKLLNEVYPNKGESKKDFIARFMKVTKDEYPDVKQKYRFEEEKGE